MKKILLSLITVGLLSTAVVGATRAYFTAQDVVPGNTLGAGVLKIKINPGVATTLPIVVTNLVPGVWTKPYSVEIYNPGDSTMMLKYKGYSADPTENKSGFYDKIWVRAAHSNCVADPGDWTLNPSLVKYEQIIRNLAFNSSQSISSSGLGINISHCWQLSFALASDAGDYYQGAGATFKLKVDATQTNNPGWTE